MEFRVKALGEKEEFVRGNLFSPILFVIVVDLLECIINKATPLGIFSTPIDNSSSPDFLVI
jgi:hypothetical protein